MNIVPITDWNREVSRNALAHVHLLSGESWSTIRYNIDPEAAERELPEGFDAWLHWMNIYPKNFGEDSRRYADGVLNTDKGGRVYPNPDLFKLEQILEYVNSESGFTKFDLAENTLAIEDARAYASGAGIRIQNNPNQYDFRGYFMGMSEMDGEDQCFIAQFIKHAGEEYFRFNLMVTHYHPMKKESALEYLMRKYTNRTNRTEFLQGFAQLNSDCGDLFFIHKNGKPIHDLYLTDLNWNEPKSLPRSKASDKPKLKYKGDRPTSFILRTDHPNYTDFETEMKAVDNHEAIDRMRYVLSSWH